MLKAHCWAINTAAAPGHKEGLRGPTGGQGTCARPSVPLATAHVLQQLLLIPGPQNAAWTHSSVERRARVCVCSQRRLPRPQCFQFPRRDQDTPNCPSMAAAARGKGPAPRGVPLDVAPALLRGAGLFLLERRRPQPTAISHAPSCLL